MNSSLISDISLYKRRYFTASESPDWIPFFGNVLILENFHNLGVSFPEVGVNKVDKINVNLFHLKKRGKCVLHLLKRRLK